MKGTCLFACEGLWVAKVRRTNMRVSLDAYLYFDEHWSDATVNGGSRRLVVSYKTRGCAQKSWPLALSANRVHRCNAKSIDPAIYYHRHLPITQMEKVLST